MTRDDSQLSFAFEAGRYNINTRDEPWADVPCHKGFAEITPEIKAWMDKEERKRDQLAEEARAEYDDVGTWDWGASLRHQWAAAQRLDKDLAPCFNKDWKPPHGERINANDGLVEKLVTPENENLDGYRSFPMGTRQDI